MKDPRLIEIELLANIDRATWQGNGWEYRRPGSYGGEELQLEDALLNLVFECAIIEGEYHRSYDLAVRWDVDPAMGLRRAAATTASRFLTHTSGIQPKFRITQRGRLRLYRLRDEMLNQDRLRDPFGVLWDKRHFVPDLEVRLRMHTFPEPFSLLLLDVDRLKEINTKLGHVGADDVLRGIFQTLQDMVKPHDAYRLGGDEAGAILPGADLKDAARIAEAVRAAVEREFQGKVIDGQGHTPTVSVGVGCATAMVSAREFNVQVDAIAERAKATGKNKVETGMVAT